MKLEQVIADYLTDDSDVDFVRFQDFGNGLEVEVTFKDGSVGRWLQNSYGHWYVAGSFSPSLTE